MPPEDIGMGLVRNRYKIGRKLGAGSFGEIYLALDVTTQAEVAFKLEPLDCSHPQLEYEARVYRALTGGGCFLI